MDIPTPFIRFAHTRDSLKNARHSKAARYSRIQQGMWIPPVRLGSKSVGWPEHEEQKLLAAQLAGLPPAEFKQLVSELVAARKSALARAA